MKALITRKSIVICSIAILIAISAIVSVNVFGTQDVVTNAGGAFSRPLQTVVTRVARAFEEIYSGRNRYQTLLERVERLEMDNEELRRNFREADILAHENDYLRELLNFSRRHGEPEMESAVVVEGWGASNFTATFQINRGSQNYHRSPVSVNDSVVTAYGMLLGRIINVGPAQSTVLSVFDPRFSAGVTIGEGGGHSIARGDFSLMNEGLLMLDHIEDDVPVIPGDTVVTSGAGGIFPAGLIIGEVVEVFTNDTGIGRFATVRPMLPIPLESIPIVAVITDFEVTAVS